MHLKLIQFLIVLLLLTNPVRAEVLWQYGLDDNNTRGRLNAVEFNSNAEFIYPEIIEIDSSTKGTIITDGPGYFHSSMTFKEVCASLGYNCQYHIRDFQAASELLIDYWNTSTTECTNVTLTYHRHGTEHNTMLFINDNTENTDNFTFGINGEEGQQTIHTVQLQNIPAGVPMHFVLRYDGNGSDNGHFIDMIRLEADNC